MTRRTATNHKTTSRQKTNKLATAITMVVEDEFDADVLKGKKYTHIRAIDVFERSKDAMLQELGDHILHGGKGFYQLVLMLSETIVHEEMASALNTVLDFAMDEIYRGMGKTASDSQRFKRELKESLRGSLNMKERIKDAGMEETFRKMIRERL